MDLGLSVQQKRILRRARASGLRGASRPQVMPPLWLIAVLTLIPLLLVWHPARYLWLLVLPPLGFWHRRRMELRFQSWALDLRQL